MTPGVVITRIASQRQEPHRRDLRSNRSELSKPQEKRLRTTDPLIHIICHGAFLSKRPVDITLDQTDITRVVKQRLDPPPG